MIRSDARKRIEEAQAAADVLATDWRGTPIKVGDMVAFPIAWGGMPLAMCEGEILEIDPEVGVCKVDLHYDSSSYVRRNNWAWARLLRCTRVEPR